MRLWVEIPVCLGLAAGLHLAILGGWPGGAPEAAGSDGAALVSLAGQSGAVEALIAAWEAPPDAMQASAAPPGPALPDPPAAPLLPAGPPRPAQAAPLAAPDGSVASLSRPEPPPAPPAPSAAAPRGAAPEHPVPARSGAPPRAEAPPAPPVRPLARPEAQALARPQQAAAGAGGGDARGAREEAAEAAALSPSARRSLVAAWGAEIRARIEARKVPPEVRASGRSVLRITVARSGAVEEVRVVESARVAALDAAALRTVRSAGRLPAAPAALDLARVSFDLPILYPAN